MDRLGTAGITLHLPKVIQNYIRFRLNFATLSNEGLHSWVDTYLIKILDKFIERIYDGDVDHHNISTTSVLNYSFYRPLHNACMNIQTILPGNIKDLVTFRYCLYSILITSHILKFRARNITFFKILISILPEI